MSKILVPLGVDDSYSSLGFIFLQELMGQILANGLKVIGKPKKTFIDTG